MDLVQFAVSHPAVNPATFRNGKHFTPRLDAMNATLKLVPTPAPARPAGDSRVRGDRPFEDALEVARELNPDTPVLCFSDAALAGTARAFIAGFPGEVSYAVKANSQPEVLTTLAAAGIAMFDVASVEEMAHVRAHVPEAAFHYHNPVKSRAEIVAAFRRFGCLRFAVDDDRELGKIAGALGLVRGLEIAVRFRLPKLGLSAHDFSSKFGATPEEAVRLLAAVAALGYRPVLTFHPGSQCTDPQAYARHIAAAAAIAREAGVRLMALNVGGGFPARYRDGATPDRDAFFDVIAGAVAASFGSAGPALECEPGRGLVASSMSLLTRVKLVKPGRAEVFLNDGIYGALLEVTQAPGLMPPYRAIREGRALDGAARPFTAYGPTCDPLDRLPVPLDLPEEIEEDDFVEFGTLGAYGAATSTRFNGYEIKDVVPVRRVLSI